MKDVVNLSTGLEYGLDAHMVDAYTRLQSSHLEAKAWDAFLMSVDSTIWYWLSKGHHINLYDCGSRRADGMSRVIWQGVPMINFCAYKAGIIPSACSPKFKDCNALTFLDHMWEHRLDKKTKKHLRYFAKYRIVKNLPNKVHGRFKKSLLDGKV